MIKVVDRISWNLNKCVMEHGTIDTSKDFPACSRRTEIFIFCLCVCLSVYPYDILQTDATRITKLDTHVPRWVPVTHLFWGHKFKGQGYE